MAILDDSSLKIDPYYKTTNGYTHMYLASDDVLMDDDKTTLQTKMNSVNSRLYNIEDRLSQFILVDKIGIPISCAAGKTFKTSQIPREIDGYTPIFCLVTGTGSNNLYNYYNIVRYNADSACYEVYTEWKNPGSTNVKDATASISVIYLKDQLY